MPKTVLRAYNLFHTDCRLHQKIKVTEKRLQKTISLKEYKTNGLAIGLKQANIKFRLH